jgi:TPR repeat protein
VLTQSSQPYVRACQFRIRWEDLRNCAEQGDAYAQNALGFMYDAGNGVPTDYQEAVRWYRLAAEQGFARSQFSLGLSYGLGRGVPRNDVLAYMWMNLATAQNNLLNELGYKETIEQRLTSEQVAEGQRLSREWLEAHPPGGN